MYSRFIYFLFPLLVTFLTFCIIVFWGIGQQFLPTGIGFRCRARVICWPTSADLSPNGNAFNSNR